MTNLEKFCVLLFIIAAHAFTTLHAQESANVRMQEKIVKYYNGKKYKKIYSMFSAEFKRSMDEDGLEYFMDYELRDRYKKMRSATYLRNEEGAHVYLLTFEKGKLEMHLAVNTDGQIATLLFVPQVKLKPGLVTETILPNNNPLSCTVDSICDRAMKKFGSEHTLVGLSIGIIKDGQQYVYGYGETHKKNKTIPGEHTIYDLGSISKTFTGLLLAAAVEQKLVKPDDDIRKYLPEEYSNLVYQHTPITLIQLVSHTSALPRLPSNLTQQSGYRDEDPYCNYTRELMMSGLKKIKLTRKPGSRSEYSNYGVALCAAILEDVFKKPYAQLVSEYITTPSGMSHTFVQLPDSLKAWMTGCYNEEGDSIADWNLNCIAPAGGISSTITDMLRYIAMNQEEQNAAVKRSHVPAYTEANGQATGYCWVITELKNGQHLIWHNGGTAGSTSFCGYIKETGTGVVVLNNSGVSVDDLAINLLKALR